MYLASSRSSVLYLLGASPLSPYPPFFFSFPLGALSFSKDFFSVAGGPLWIQFINVW